MIITDTVNFALGAAFFVSSLFKAIFAYLAENKLPGDGKVHIKGIGLQQTLPEDLPSITEVKAALPKRCFQSELSTSMYYAVKDFVQVALAVLIYVYLDSWVASSLALRAALALLYWAVQGTFFFALFVLGHDCGHGSFSDNVLLNDVVGTVSHAVLMVPYYQWKLSHRNHHQNTGNFDRDEVFYPVRRSQQTPSGSKMLPGFAFGVGWYIYLAVGYNPRRVHHFQPFDAMFVGHLVGCLFSLAGIVISLYFVYLYLVVYGLVSLVVVYAVPLFVFGSYVVVVTFLHHSEVNIPWYSDGRWTYVRGQLSSVDRHYGIVHDVIHSIGTHQMHHMFTRIPHYRLEEATEHFRRAYPHLVRACDEPILPSFVRMFQKFEEQATLEENAKEHVYK